MGRKAEMVEWLLCPDVQRGPGHQGHPKWSLLFAGFKILPSRLKSKKHPEKEHLIKTMLLKAQGSPQSNNLVPSADSPDTSQSLDYGNATSHPMAGPKQASTWHSHISCRRNSAWTPQPLPPRREQLSAPSSCPSLHSVWLEKGTFQAEQLNKDAVRAQTDAHAARSASLSKASKGTTVHLHLVHLYRNR